MYVLTGVGEELRGRTDEPSATADAAGVVVVLFELPSAELPDVGDDMDVGVGDECTCVAAVRGTCLAFSMSIGISCSRVIHKSQGQ